MSASRIRVPLLGRMLVLLLLLALVPLVVVGTVSIRRGADTVGQTAEQNLQLVAATTAARLDDSLAQAQRLQIVVATTDTVVQACAAPPAKRKDLLPAAERWLREVLAAAPDIALAYLADDQGVCIVSTSPNMVGLDYSKTRDYMRRALAGENVISDLAVGITTREPGIFMAGPVREPGGRLAGVVVLKLKGEIVDRVCQDVSRQIAQGFAVVIDANEVIIWHPDPKRLYHSLGTLSPEALERIDPKLQYGVERIEPGGQDDIVRVLRQGQDRGPLRGVAANGLPYVGGYARLSLRPWTVGVIQPRALFDRPIDELAAAQKWWIVGVGLLAALCAFWVSYGLLRPIRSLRSAAMKAADGDWSARAAVHSNDELGDLAQAYNAMMPALEERARMQQDLSLAQEVQRQTQEQADLLRAQQETLREAEERTRLILDSAAEGIFGVDTEGLITFVNPGRLPNARLRARRDDRAAFAPAHPPQPRRRQPLPPGGVPDVRRLRAGRGQPHRRRVPLAQGRHGPAGRVRRDANQQGRHPRRRGDQLHGHHRAQARRSSSARDGAVLPQRARAGAGRVDDH